MIIGERYRPEKIKGTYDAICIGSGMGSLACAGLLALMGKRVLVLEKHYTAGGFTHVFKRKGFEWDVGVHYTADLNYGNQISARIFRAITNNKVIFDSMGDTYDTIVIGDRSYPLRKGKEAFFKDMSGYFPQDVPAIRAYMELVRKTARAAAKHFGARSAPFFIAPFLRAGVPDAFTRNTKEVLDELTDNAELKAVLCGQFGDYGLPPAQSCFAIHALVASHYFNGGYYPRGGASEIAKNILPTIQAAGGAVMIRAEVTELLLEDQRCVGVKLSDGNEIKTPLVISGIGVGLTYGKLLPQAMRGQLKLDQKLADLDTSCAHLSLYMGLDGSAKDLNLPTTNLWIYNHNDHDKAIADYQADPNGPFPLVYLSFPSAKDKDWDNRYPDRATIQAITLADYADFEPWRETQWHKRGEDYDTFKQTLVDKLTDVVVKHFPQIEGRIIHNELSTPLSTEHFANWPAGAIYGLAHTPDRFKADWIKPKSPVKGLYLTGADVLTAGVAGALSSSFLTMSAILGPSMFRLTRLLSKTPPSTDTTALAN